MTAPRCTRPRAHAGAGALVASVVVAGSLLLAGCTAAPGEPSVALEDPEQTEAAPAPSGTTGGIAVDPATPDDSSATSATTPDAAPRDGDDRAGRRPALARHRLGEREEDHRPHGAGVGAWTSARCSRALRPLVQDADLAVCHEEVPFAPAAGPVPSYPLFAAPPADRTLHRRRSAGTPARRRPTTASTRGSPGWCGPPTLLERQGVAPRRHLPHRRPSGASRCIVDGERRDGRRWSAAPTALNGLAAAGRAARGRSRCGTPTTCSPRPAPPAGPAPTSCSSQYTGHRVRPRADSAAGRAGRPR